MGGDPGVDSLIQYRLIPVEVPTDGGEGRLASNSAGEESPEMVVIYGCFRFSLRD